MLITYVDSKELGTCPAAVVMDDGTIQVNADVWNLYTPYQQRFILAHEQGHYELQTSSEEQADLYALRRLHGSEPQSLKQSIETLVKMGNAIPPHRVEALYRQALMIDTEINHNPKAARELTMLNNNNNKNNKIMRQSKYNLYNRADGQVPTALNLETAPEELLYNAESSKPSGSFIHFISQRRPGVQIGGVFLDLNTILTMSILVVLCMIYKKK